MKKRRNIIVGIDGVPFELIERFSSQGVMPNFRKLRGTFHFSKMQSSIPAVSSVSWSSIITGKNPGEHGIFGFNDFIDNTYSIRFPNYLALKEKPFWECKSNKKSLIINVPSTYPARPLNGIHISGFIALDIEKAVYPKKVLPEINKLNYKVDIDTHLVHKQSWDMFLKDSIEILKIRFKAFEYFKKKDDWDNIMIVFTGTDRLLHFLWNLVDDKSNANYDLFLEFFRILDNKIGKIYNCISEKDTFIILSDHGMEYIKKNININTVLEENEILSLSDKGKNYNRVKKETMAFVLDPGRLYLNRKDRFPRGWITEDEESEMLKEIEKILFNLTYEGQPLIKYLFRKSEIYRGDYIKNAPDLILIENKGFNFKGSIGKQEVFEDEHKFSGKHNMNAFILYNNENTLESPNVEDVCSLLNGD